MNITDQKLFDLLKRIQKGEQFFRPENDSDEANIAFKSDVNRLRELKELGYIQVSDKGFIKNYTNGKGYYNIVGPCEITYKGEQALEYESETTVAAGSQTEILQNTVSGGADSVPIAGERTNAPQPSFQILKKRLDDLSDHITKDFDLLKRYENALRLEDDPKRCARYENEIESLKTSALNHAKEYESLERHLGEEVTAPPQSVASEMESVHEKLDALLAGQTSIHQHLGALGRAILERYDAGEQRILDGVLEKITEAQAQSVEAILDAFENNQIDEAEMNATVEAVRQALIKIEEQGKNIIPEQEKLVEAVNAPQFNVKHKLKMTIPVVPLLLNYETEFELGGGLNLEGVWNNLKNRFSRK